MPKHYTACVWCSALVWVDPPPEPEQDVVCSPECGQKERWFRRQFSDEAIRQRFLKQHGIDIGRNK